MVLRAILVPITYDEASTFFRYINLGHYWPGDGLWDANNHILNSFLSIWSYRLFGVDEVWLRLPNVLASLVYFFAAVGLTSLIENKRLKWVLLIALCCNHFVLEFFAVTRGYGLSMAFLLLSVFSVYNWSLKGSFVGLVVGLAAIQLATLSNLSLLVINLLLTLWVVVWLFVNIKTRIVASLVAIGAALWCVKWFIELSFQYKEKGLLYYGSGAGFWESTLGSLAEFGFPAVELVFPYFATLLCLAILIASMAYLFRVGIDERGLFSYLFFGALVAVVVMHHLLDVNYPEDRVAMHFLVLAPTALVFLVDKLVSEASGPKLPLVLMASSVLLTLFPINTILSANLTHVQLWKEDACAREFYFLIKQESIESETTPTIAGYRLRDLPLYYYGFKHDRPVTVIQDIGYKGDEADYQYAVLGEDGMWDRYEKLNHNPESGITLVKRKQRKPELLWVEKTTPSKDLNSEPFTVFYESDIDTMGGKDLLWEIELDMPRLEEPFQAWITTDIGTPEGESVMQETVVLDWLRPGWKEGDVLRQKILMPNIPNKASHIKLFFWNIDEKPIALGETRVKLIELKDN